MYQTQIKHIVDERIKHDGVMETGIQGVQLFRATQAIPCVPAVYEPSVVAIACGAKEIVLDGAKLVYDSAQYLVCPMSLPMKAGTPNASPENPLLGVLISLNVGVMSELVIEMVNAGGAHPVIKSETQAIRLAHWDQGFGDALLRLLQLGDNETDLAVLGKLRLRELYYAILTGEAGGFARQAFGTDNAIARAIAHVASNLDTPISIDALASRAGMSRAVFHRKFKQATTMSPIQFVKSLRLNNAAMKIADGMTISEAAFDVGYVSASQFSREFKRVYGQSPRQWGDFSLVQ